MSTCIITTGEKEKDSLKPPFTRQVLESAEGEGDCVVVKPFRARDAVQQQQGVKRALHQCYREKKLQMLSHPQSAVLNLPLCWMFSSGAGMEPRAWHTLSAAAHPATGSEGPFPGLLSSAREVLDTWGQTF